MNQPARIIIMTCLILTSTALAGQAPQGPASEYTDPETGISFARVKGGCFEMGCGSWHWDGANGSNCENDEKPVQNVCLDSFYMGRFEVTQGQWQAVTGNAPAFNKTCGPDCPVETVSWDDVQDFIAGLNASRKSPGRFRLPTEAEWEYACRSRGKEELFCGGDVNPPLAWYRVNSRGRSHEVGTRRPNSLGIHDMGGNVLEWCSDYYGIYSKPPQQNPAGPSSGDTRVIRGGSWGSHTSRFCRAAFREQYLPHGRSKFIGFRLVLDKGGKNL